MVKERTMDKREFLEFCARLWDEERIEIRMSVPRKKPKPGRPPKIVTEAVEILKEAIKTRTYPADIDLVCIKDLQNHLPHLKIMTPHHVGRALRMVGAKKYNQVFDGGVSRVTVWGVRNLLILDALKPNEREEIFLRSRSTREFRKPPEKPEYVRHRKSETNSESDDKN